MFIVMMQYTHAIESKKSFFHVEPHVRIYSHMQNINGFVDWIKESLEEYEYRGYHRAPSRERDDVSLDDVDVMFPGIYELSNAARVFGHAGLSNKIDAMTVDIIRSVRGRPDDMITIYRAIPASLDQNRHIINPGDWVTINKSYAIQHGLRFDDGYKILQSKVRVGDLYTDGNSIHEFGYDPV